MSPKKDFSAGAEQIEGFEVKFKVKRRPSKKGNPIRVIDCRGQIVGKNFDRVIIKGIDIPGLYNRPLDAIEVMV